MKLDVRETITYVYPENNGDRIQLIELQKQNIVKAFDFSASKVNRHLGVVYSLKVTPEVFESYQDKNKNLSKLL